MLDSDLFWFDEGDDDFENDDDDDFQDTDIFFMSLLMDDSDGVELS